MPSRDRQIEIKKLIEHNERLVQIAIVDAESGEEQRVNDVVNFLSEILDSIIDSRDTYKDKYEYLMFQNIPYQGALRQLYASKPDHFNEASFLTSFRYGFYKIWCQGFVSSQYSSCRYLVFKIQELLIKLTNVPANDSVVREFLICLVQQLQFGINRGKERDNFLIGPAYQWYFNVALSTDDDQEFKIEYLRHFDEFFWQSIRVIISNGGFGVFKSLVSTLFQGSHGSFIMIRRAYEYFDSLRLQRINLSEISALDRDIFLITDQSQLITIAERIDAIVETYRDSLAAGFSSTDVKIILERNAQRTFKVNNLKVYVFLIGAFLVFKKKYDWIRVLWQYKQPSDADAVWGGNAVLPDDLYSIFRYLLNERNNEDRVQFAWEERHGVSTHYKRYGLLLLTRLYFIPQFYVYQDPLNIQNFIQAIGMKDLNNIIRVCESLMRNVSIIDESKLFPRTIPKPKGDGIIDVGLKEEVESLLRRIIDAANSSIVYRRDHQQFSQIQYEELMENVNTNFERENQIVTILKSNGLHSVRHVQNVDNNETVEFRLTRPKREFMAQFEDIGVSVGYEVSRNLSFKLLNSIKGQLDLCSTKPVVKY